MVTKGQFLERMTVVAVGEHSLEALYHRGSPGPGAVIAAGYRALGGNMEAPVPAEVVWALCQAGVSTLRFNYRGMGASTGTPALRALDPDSMAEELATHGALDAAVDDLVATAAQHHENTGRNGVHLVGYSLGACVVAAALDRVEQIASVTLISPPVRIAALRFADDEHRPGVVLVGTEDRFAPLEDVRTAVGDRLFVESISDADHGYQRGLSQLGRRISARLAATDNDTT